MRHERRYGQRLTRLESQLSTGADYALVVRVSLWAKLLRMNPDEWATRDIVEVCARALDQCDRLPTPKHRVIATMIRDRLAMLDDHVGPDETDPERLDQLTSFGPSPEIAAALIGVATQTLITPPDRGGAPGAKRRLYERLGLAIPPELDP